MNLAIPSLMTIDSPREDGTTCAPLMRSNFHIPGQMEMQTPTSDEEETKDGCLADYESN